MIAYHLTAYLSIQKRRILVVIISALPFLCMQLFSLPDIIDQYSRSTYSGGSIKDGGRI